MIDNIPIVVEASIGAATAPNHADHGELLFQQADIAMYRAKRRASVYAVYSPEYNLHSPEKLGLMAELRDAIEQDQLLLHFQPKVGLKDNRIIGSEASIRWQHPRHGLLSPDKFIGAAEQAGLIKPPHALGVAGGINALRSRARRWRSSAGQCQSLCSFIACLSGCLPDPLPVVGLKIDRIAATGTRRSLSRPARQGRSVVTGWF